MEKEVVWTDVAQHDFWDIVAYLKEAWPERVLDGFHRSLALKYLFFKSNLILVLKVKNILNTGER